MTGMGVLESALRLTNGVGTFYFGHWVGWGPFRGGGI